MCIDVIYSSIRSIDLIVLEGFRMVIKGLSFVHYLCLFLPFQYSHQSFLYPLFAFLLKLKALILCPPKPSHFQSNPITNLDSYSHNFRPCH